MLGCLSQARNLISRIIAEEATFNPDVILWQRELKPSHELHIESDSCIVKQQNTAPRTYAVDGHRDEGEGVYSGIKRAPEGHFNLPFSIHSFIYSFTQRH